MKPFDESDPAARLRAETDARAAVDEPYKKIAAEYNESREIETITADMSVGTDESRNVGYAMLKLIYKELELDMFWRKVSSHRKFEYNPDKIFQLLVFARVIKPGSKKFTYDNKHVFFEDFGDFSVDDVYNALDLFAENEAALQKWIYDHSVTKNKRDLSVGYFDINKPDIDDVDEDGNLLLKHYRKYGPEKNHRKDPIVEMGLLMDKTGIPLSYDLFAGNESEKVNMLPIVNRTRVQYGIDRIIIVADRGLNTSDNIYLLNGDNKSDNNPRDGYVYGQSVRGADEEFKKWVLDKNGYIDTPMKDIDENFNENDRSKDRVFRHKSRIYPKRIYI